MGLAFIFLVGVMAWIVELKCQQGGPATRYGFAILAVLFRTPVVMTLLVLVGLPALPSCQPVRGGSGNWYPSVAA